MRKSTFLNLLYLLFFTNIFVACSGNFLNVLSYAEESIDINPSAVLDTLSIVSGEKMHGKNAARYSLAMSAALDKNNIPAANDSLISVAVEWYRRHPEPEKLMKSFLYLGKIQQKEGHYASSITTFSQAYEAGQRTGNHYYLGMVQRGIAQSYASNYMRIKAIEHMNNAYEEFCLAGKQSHADWALYNLASYHLSLKNTQMCDSLVSIVERRAKESGDRSLLINICRVHAEMAIGSYEDGPLTIKLYKYMVDSLGLPLSVRDAAKLAHAYELIGDRATSDSLMSLADKGGMDNLTKGIISFDKHHIARLRGDYKAAYEYLDHSVFVEDSLVNVLLEQSVETAQTEFYRDRLNLNKALIGRRNDQITILFLLLISAMAVSCLLVKAKRKDEREHVILVNSLKENLAEMVSRETDLSRSVSSLILNKLRRLNSLSEAFFYQGRDGSSEKRVYKEVEKELAKYRNDDSLKDIESFVNLYKDGIMAKLRQEIALNESEYCFCCYYFAGLNASSIRVLTDEGKSNIYSKKSRIKKTIAESGTPHCDLFLKELG